jgi:hypothetical protein
MGRMHYGFSIHETNGHAIEEGRMHDFIFKEKMDKPFAIIECNLSSYSENKWTNLRTWQNAL